MNSINTHRVVFWYILGGPFKTADKNPAQCYVGASSSDCKLWKQKILTNLLFAHGTLPDDKFHKFITTCKL